MNISPSEEQQEILDYVDDGYNVLTDSVAGSGKTTTILFLAKRFPEKRIMAMTYNSRLKSETRDRVRKNGIQNLEVHSYHSAGLAYYIRPCINDIHLGNIVRNNITIHPLPVVDILILDETQDMTKSYFDFLSKFIKDLKNPNLQLFVMGDHKQCIYDFAQKGADYRFLTLAEQIFPSKRAWKKCYLRTSYRITKPMEWFMNEVVLGYPRLKSVKDISIPIHYVTGDPFTNVPNFIVEELKRHFAGGVKPGDIFILAPSIRSVNINNPIKRLENSLVRSGVPCFVPLSDDEELSDEVIEGKVTFSSFHQSKGLERKIVIVASFSSSLYYIFKDASKETCPNIVYVAATRAKETLYLLGEGGQNTALPFLRHELMVENPNFRRIRTDSDDEGGRSVGSQSPRTYDRQDLKRVTDLTRFIPDGDLAQIIELCKVKTIQGASKSIDIPCIIETPGNKKENVSDLNGIAIPTIYEHRKKNYISIQMDLETNFMNTLRAGGKLTNEQKEWIAAIQKEPKSPEDYLKLANIYSAYISGYLYKITQIKNYGWLTVEMVEKLVGVLEAAVRGLPEEMCFEETLSCPGYIFNNNEIQIEGRADLIDSEVLWEVKCVNTISPEHIVQLALYAWLWQETEFEKKGSRRFCLINLRTAEILEITGIGNLKYIVDICLDNAFRKKQEVSDEDFVAACLAGPGASKKVSNVSTSQCLILDD